MTHSALLLTTKQISQKSYELIFNFIRKKKHLMRRSGHADDWRFGSTQLLIPGYLRNGIQCKKNHNFVVMTL